MPGRVPAQSRGLRIPTAKRADVFRLLLAESVTKRVEKTVRIGLGETLHELVAMPHKRRRALLFVEIQRDAVERECFERASGTARRSVLRLHGHVGFRFEFCSGDS